MRSSSGTTRVEEPARAVSVTAPRQALRAAGVPYPLVDRVLDIEPGRRGLARKVVSANEPYFAGHFPGIPVMPGVLLCAALAELAALVVASDGPDEPPPVLYELPRARFRHPVFPGDALDMRVEVEAGPPWRCRGEATVAGRVVVEAELLLGVSDEPYVYPTAVVARQAELGPRVRIGPYAVIGPHVHIGAGTWIGAHAVIQGHTTLGADNRVFPFASLGQPPQDLKYR